LAGIFLANGFPHFTQGIAGKKFPTPFARPPGRGKSSSPVNVLWGMVNFAIGYILISRVGKFRFGASIDVLLVWLGALTIAVLLAWHFQRLNDQ
jgi:hypothetical protein